jgi:hypothetical protein
MDESILLTDDDVLRFTQSTRKQFLDNLLKAGFPESVKEQQVFLMAMSDMDRTALGNKRIGANEKQAAADVLVAKAIAQISTQCGSGNPFENSRTGELPQLKSELLPEANAAPGETNVGLCEENYKSLMEMFD